MNIDWKKPDRIKGSGETQTLDMILLDVIQAGIADTRAEAMKYVRQKIPAESFYQKKIMEYIRKWAKERGYDCLCWKATQGMYSRGGVSDVLAVVGCDGVGAMLAVEVKRPIFGDTSDLQIQFIESVNRCGGFACVAVYPEDLHPILEKLEARLQSGGAG